MSSPDLSPLTYFVMLAGPTLAAILSFFCSIWFQDRKQKLEIKRSLFITLMVNRVFGAYSQERMGALNSIDVIFEDSPKIRELWHNYYVALSQDPMNDQIVNHSHLDLLSEMAQSLGYKALKQTDIDKFYLPKGMLESTKLIEDTQREWLRVLRNTSHLVVDRKDDERIVS